MFDTQQQANAAAHPPPKPVIQTVSIEVMPVGAGRLSVSLAGTYLDEEELELFNGELAGARVASLDEALTLIGRTMAAAFGLSV